VFRLPTLRLGRVLGIPIEINASWFAIFLLIAGVLSFDIYPSLFPGRPAWVDVVGGVVSALLFFTSLVAHEFSHSLVARRFGIRVERITLFIFGGVAQLAEEPRTPGRELAMSLAGPGMSLALFALFGAAVAGLMAVGASDALWGPAAYLSVMNLGLAIFNLAPGFPMDGGRVLRSYLWWATGDKRVATFIASGGGVVLATLMAGAGMWLGVHGDLSGAWIALVGLFLGRLAVDSYRLQADRLRLAVTPVGSVRMLPLPIAGADAPPSSPADEAPGTFPPLTGVLDAGMLVGVRPSGYPAAQADAGFILSEEVLGGRDLFIDVADSLGTALARFERGAPALVAVSAARAVGVVTLASLER
jgi:Zn-dependent protease